MACDVDQLIRQIVEFRDQRNWAQFHNPKDLALGLSIEAAELNELFLWKKPEEADPTRVREELADILIFALMLLEKYGLDLEKIVQEKLASNAEKYPADKARNSAAKYTDL
ncbi:nucleotide pyrophosphohydrolase [Candidatus Deferrimicrobium sp.]|uniref:nucleotide pyrophosphohydrolase n=1 Tax=Candidatus Deferrimicrobium sp. TaxID=3060586 RepID=UPI00271AF96D|nr:nucleotide pyrophosphohydrolase [Candidatus Deferrimicrobium sp.]MDO8737484.1 nucleotide pyrophosphohydrolase [Candidatus Deferrimicrobium sp.]